MDRNDLVPDKLQDPVDHGFEALQNLFVRKCHVSLFNTSLWELGLDAYIDSPFLTIVSEVGLYSVLEIHDTLSIDLACSSRTVGQLHLPDLRAQDVAEVSVQGGRTTRVTRTRCTFCDGERLLFLYFVGDQIDRTTTAIDNEYGVTNLEVEKPGFRTEHGSGFGFGDQGKSVVILIAKESSLNSSRTSSSFTGIVPDSGHGQVVSDVALFTIEYLAERLLQLVAHCLSEVEKVIGGDIDLRLSRR